MKVHQLAFMTVCLLCLAEATVSTSEAATSFNGSTIIGIDQQERTVTFRTKEDKWTSQWMTRSSYKKKRFRRAIR